jgi:hypothetical protein
LTKNGYVYTIERTSHLLLIHVSWGRGDVSHVIASPPSCVVPYALLALLGKTPGYGRSKMEGKRNRLWIAMAKLSPTRGTVFILSIGLIAWGLFLANPWVNTFDSTNTYTAMKGVATEAAWAALFLAGGVCMFIGVLRRDVFLLRAGAMLGFLLWICVSILIAFSNHAAVGIITNAILALLHGWLYVQAKMRPENLAKNVKVVALDDEEVEQGVGYIEPKKGKK